MVRILLVDDDVCLRKLVAGALERAGFEVSQAAGASQALRQLAAGRFDILITDFSMPGGDGIELLTRVMAGPPPHPRMILVSGSFASDRRLQDFAAAHPGILTLEKPFGSGTLLKLVA